jgi:hypothetical protein
MRSTATKHDLQAAHFGWEGVTATTSVPGPHSALLAESTSHPLANLLPLPTPALQSSSNGASAVATQPGLLLPCGEGGAWDEAGVGHAVVRYFLGDDEQRWFMWYTGRSTACPDLDGVFPSSGSIGTIEKAGRSSRCWQLSRRLLPLHLLLREPQCWLNYCLDLTLTHHHYPSVRLGGVIRWHQLAARQRHGGGGSGPAASTGCWQSAGT